MRALGVGFAALVLLAAVTAAAQEPIPADEWSSLSYRPAPSPLDYIMVDGSRIGDFALPVVSLHFEHAIRPLEVGTQCGIRPEISCDVNPTITRSIQGNVRAKTRKIAAALGMNARTLSWMDVTVWKMLTRTPATRPASSIGSETIMASSMA